MTHFSGVFYFTRKPLSGISVSGQLRMHKFQYQAFTNHFIFSQHDSTHSATTNLFFDSIAIHPDVAFFQIFDIENFHSLCSIGRLVCSARFFICPGLIDFSQPGFKKFLPVNIQFGQFKIIAQLDDNFFRGISHGRLHLGYHFQNSFPHIFRMRFSSQFGYGFKRLTLYHGFGHFQAPKSDFQTLAIT